MYTSRWYVRNYARIVCQGGEHLKTVILIGDIVRQGASSLCGAADRFTLRQGQSINI
jgi:hypothetical protein